MGLGLRVICTKSNSAQSLKLLKYSESYLHLDTRLPKVDTQTIGVMAVVSNKLGDGLECGSASNVEASLIQLPYPVVFNSVSVAYCKARPYNLQYFTYYNISIMHRKPRLILFHLQYNKISVMYCRARPSCYDILLTKTISSILHSQIYNIISLTKPSPSQTAVRLSHLQHFTFKNKKTFSISLDFHSRTLYAEIYIFLQQNMR